MNILPPLATVWHHFAMKNLGDGVDITLFDCSGRIDPKTLPGIRVQKFLNFYASTKSDEFIKHVSKNRKIAWICDDDMFPMDRGMIDVLTREFAVPNTASVSFRPRDWWHFVIDGKEHPVSSSYCIAFNRDILVEKEHLSLAPAGGNTHPSTVGRKIKRYDTADKANEILLQKGYRCFVVPEEERKTYLTGFSGVSGAVMLLSYFRTAEETVAYFETPEKKNWSGSLLFGVLSAMFAVSYIQELHTMITGKPYPLPSLPSRERLEKILSDHAQYLRPDQSMDSVREAGERLKASL